MTAWKCATRALPAENAWVKNLAESKKTKSGRKKKLKRETNIFLQPAQYNNTNYGARISINCEPTQSQTQS